MVRLETTRLSHRATLQDHLYSGWFAPKHLSEIEKYREGVRDASMHAPWKDSTWAERVDEGEPSSKCGSSHSTLHLVFTDQGLEQPLSSWAISLFACVPKSIPKWRTSWKITLSMSSDIYRVTLMYHFTGR